MSFSLNCTVEKEASKRVRLILLHHLHASEEICSIRALLQLSSILSQYNREDRIWLQLRPSQDSHSMRGEAVSRQRNQDKNTP